MSPDFSVVVVGEGEERLGGFAVEALRRVWSSLARSRWTAALPWEWLSMGTILRAADSRRRRVGSRNDLVRNPSDRSHKGNSGQPYQNKL